MPEFAVRLYEPRDREVLCDICYATGLMGESMDPVFGDQRLFTDYWMTYYLDHEPESAFVALADDEPVGYLVGCCDTRRFERVQSTVVWPMLWRRLITGRYGLPLRVVRFLWRTFRSQTQDRALEPPLHEYPAHLHMNVAAGHRNQGHGARLMVAFLDHLHARGVRGVHLMTTNHNTLAVPFYENRGFRLEDRAPVSVYDPYLTRPVEALLYVRIVPLPTEAAVS